MFAFSAPHTPALSLYEEKKRKKPGSMDRRLELIQTLVDLTKQYLVASAPQSPGAPQIESPNRRSSRVLRPDPYCRQEGAGKAARKGGKGKGLRKPKWNGGKGKGKGDRKYVASNGKNREYPKFPSCRRQPTKNECKESDVMEI